MKTSKLPFRSKIPLSYYFMLEVWHDAMMTETRAKVCQRIREDDGKFRKVDVITEGRFMVRAEFAYITEALAYIATLGDLQNG